MHEQIVRFRFPGSAGCYSVIVTPTDSHFHAAVVAVLWNARALLLRAKSKRKGVLTESDVCDAEGFEMARDRL